MYWPRQLRAGLFRHLAIPPTFGGAASHISALVRMRETSLSTTCDRRCAFSAELCGTTAVWTFACRYSSGTAWLNQADTSYTGAVLAVSGTGLGSAEAQ